MTTNYTDEQIDRAVDAFEKYCPSAKSIYLKGGIRAALATLTPSSLGSGDAVSCAVLYEQLTPLANKDCRDCDGRGVYYGNVCVCGCVTSRIPVKSCVPSAPIDSECLSCGQLIGYCDCNDEDAALAKGNEHE